MPTPTNNPTVVTNSAQKNQWLAERPYILAIIIVIALFLWMFSGTMNAQNIASKHQKNTQQKRNVPIAKVQVKTMQAQSIHDSVELYGRTEPSRTATLRAEVSGKITAILAKRGAYVKKGDIIAEIESNDLISQLKYTQALLKQRKIEYQGAKSLNSKGYQGQAKLAQAFSALEAAKADLIRIKLAVEHTVIKAPFAGVLNDRYIEIGDYVKTGDKIALIADLNPLIIRAYATENQINQLFVGQNADIRLLNHANMQGKVRYIASVADQATNTFKIEVAINNSDNQLAAGLSSEMDIALQQVLAIKLSPALLALDEKGNIGIKSVVNQQVVFTPIHIVKTEPDGIWLTGLGTSANIIVLGQGFVRAGDKVDAVTVFKQAIKEQGE
jgi:multidrug efflux system membrane fusion protein